MTGGKVEKKKRIRREKEGEEEEKKTMSCWKTCMCKHDLEELMETEDTTRQTMYISPNSETCLCNNCCRRTAESIT